MQNTYFTSWFIRVWLFKDTLYLSLMWLKISGTLGSARVFRISRKSLFEISLPILIISWSVTSKASIGKNEMQSANTWKYRVHSCRGINQSRNGGYFYKLLYGGYAVIGPEAYSFLDQRESPLSWKGHDNLIVQPINAHRQRLRSTMIASGIIEKMNVYSEKRNYGENESRITLRTVLKHGNYAWIWTKFFFQFLWYNHRSKSQSKSITIL